MPFLSNASDDELALIGCGVALAVSFGLMFVSAYFGKARQASEQGDHTSPLPFADRRDSNTPNRSGKAA